MGELIKKAENLSLPYTRAYFKHLCLGCLAVAMLSFPATLYAQDKANEKAAKEERAPMVRIPYQGKVIDDLDTPLAGVNVSVKGQKGIGTMTAINGEFKIILSDDTYTFVFSYIGMKTQEVRFASSKKVTVRLESDAELLEETVVTGTYVRKAESFTGSAATYKAKDLKSIGNQNVLQSLSALDPSFVIMDNNLMGSNPNAVMDISINGKTSITGLSDTYGSTPDQPLFILDGFESTLQRISDLSMDLLQESKFGRIQVDSLVLCPVMELVDILKRFV